MLKAIKKIYQAHKKWIAIGLIAVLSPISLYMNWPSPAANPTKTREQQLVKAIQIAKREGRKSNALPPGAPVTFRALCRHLIIDGKTPDRDTLTLGSRNGTGKNLTSWGTNPAKGFPLPPIFSSGPPATDQIVEPTESAKIDTPPPPDVETPIRTTPIPPGETPLTTPFQEDPP